MCLVVQQKTNFFLCVSCTLDLNIEYIQKLANLILSSFAIWGIAASLDISHNTGLSPDHCFRLANIESVRNIVPITKVRSNSTFEIKQNIHIQLN
jgi:hypothetical protein